MRLTSWRLCGLRLVSIFNNMTVEMIHGPRSYQSDDTSIRGMLEEPMNIPRQCCSAFSSDSSHEFAELTMTDSIQMKGRPDGMQQSRVLSSHMTQRVVECGHGSLDEGFERIYHELASHRTLLEQIRESHLAKDGNDRIDIERSMIEATAGNDSESCSDLDDELSIYSARSCISHTSQHTSDYDSCYLADDFCSIYDDSLRALTPSPLGYLERSSSCYFESYTTGGLFAENFFLIGRKRANKAQWVQEYFIIHAATPRRWEQITASVDFQYLPDRAALLGADTPHDFDNRLLLLPEYLTNEISELLWATQRFPVANFSLSLEQDEGGTISTNHAKSKIEENRKEGDLSEQEQMIRDIEDLQCEQFLESQIITESRRSCTSFFALAESQRCIERKAPFVSSGIHGTNGIRNFFEDLKFLKSLHDHKLIAQFKGVVLNETRTHLRGYLMERPGLGSLVGMLTGAHVKSKSIPWKIRERWAQQLVGAIADLHKIGSSFGSLWTANDIEIRGDDTIMLVAPRSSQTFFDSRAGMRAPELRHIPLSDLPQWAQHVTFRTEIFSLGLHLWMLAEHVNNTAGRFCPRFACPRRPRYACAADHADPIELPYCSAGVPPYINEIIKGCRAPSPNDRMTACQLLTLFPPGLDRADAISAQDLELLNECAVPTMYGQPFSRYCGECGSRNMEVAYHCNKCDEANFDICQICFDHGIRCLDPEHTLVV